MKQFIKIGIIYFLRAILRLFYLFPVNERKIVFVSWMGRNYACNPKYIFEYMYNTFADKFLYVWSLKDKKALPDCYSKVKVCGYLTLKYMYSVMTAKYVITNMAIEPFFPCRETQKIIYTWHGGGAYKKMDDISVLKKRRWSIRLMRNMRSKMIAYVISSCKKFSEIYSLVWNIPQDRFLPVGMPRNDILFSGNMKNKEKVYKYYNIAPEKKTILYAPTFRGDFKNPENREQSIKFDIEKIVDSLKTKYGDSFVFLYRMHDIIRFQKIDISQIRAVADYPDMQELLSAVDSMITDYSSSIWDFSFTFKPCFIYAPDIKNYQKEQGFYTPIEDWPFPLAETSEQLIENMTSFNEDEYIQAVKKHHEALGSYETGTACEQFCNLVFQPNGM